VLYILHKYHEIAHNRPVLRLDLSLICLVGSKPDAQDIDLRTNTPGSEISSGIDQNTCHRQPSPKINRQAPLVDGSISTSLKPRGRVLWRMRLVYGAKFD
jgi:hypothetical protein